MFTSGGAGEPTALLALRRGTGNQDAFSCWPTRGRRQQPAGWRRGQCPAACSRVRAGEGFREAAAEAASPPLRRFFTCMSPSHPRPPAPAADDANSMTQGCTYDADGWAGPRRRTSHCSTACSSLPPPRRLLATRAAPLPRGLLCAALLLRQQYLDARKSAVHNCRGE